MSNQQPQMVDSLDFAVPILIWVWLFIASVVGLEALLGSAAMYGGNMCDTSGAIASYCGVPPIGLWVAIAIATAGTYEINRRLRDWMQAIADKHGSVADWIGEKL